jgi:hypothetical protein
VVDAAGAGFGNLNTSSAGTGDNRFQAELSVKVLDQRAGTD